MRTPWLALLVAVILSAVAGQVSAEQEVLDSLIQLALKNNPGLRAAVQTEASFAENARAAGTLPDPLLTVGVMNLPTNSLALDETPMSGVAVGFTQTIPWPGTLGARSELADARRRQSEQTVLTTRNALIRTVTDAYNDYSYWSHALGVVDDYRELLRATRDIAEVRYANGDTPAQDVLRISSMLSRTDIRRLKAEQNQLTALLSLRRAVGDTSLSLNLPPDLSEPTGANPVPRSVRNNPLLTEASIRTEQARIRQHLAHKGYWPDLMFGIDYRFRKNLMGDPAQGADFVTFRFGLKLPFWSLFSQKHEVSAARYQEHSSIAHERTVEDLLTTRLAEARARLEMIQNSLTHYDSSIVPETAATVEAAQVAYEVGEVDFNSLLTAQADAFEIRLERLDYVRQYHQTRAALAELAGSINER